jgi:hypothetical protein
MNIDASETLGSEAHDDALRVKKSSIVTVSIDYRKAPPLVRKIWPENDRDITSSADDVACLPLAAGVDRESQVVVRRELAV